MILIDAGILLYAYDLESPWHPIARAWLEEAFGTVPIVRLAAATVTAFLGVVTDGRLSRNPKPIAQATHIVDGWLERENVAILEPGAQYWPVLRTLLHESRIAGGRLAEAHLAALAIEHGATFYTNDRDFRRFPKLDVWFPLLDEA